MSDFRFFKPSTPFSPANRDMYRAPSGPTPELDPFTGKPMTDPFTGKPVTRGEIAAQVEGYGKDPAAAAAPAFAAPAKKKKKKAAPAPWRPLQEKRMANPAREAERQRKEAMRRTQQQQASEVPFSDKLHTRTYINPEREAGRKSSEFGG